MSGSISERLLEFLPIHLTFDEKYDLIKNLWIKLQPKSILRINLSPDQDIRKLIETITKTVINSLDFSIPDRLRNRLNWLSRDDSKQAEIMIKRIFEKESQIIMESVRTEVQNILSIIKYDKDNKVKGLRVIYIANTTIEIKLKKANLFRRILNEFW